MDVTKIDRNMTVKKVNTEGIKWISADEAPVQLLGFKWHQQDKTYRRLPLEPKHKLSSAVHSLANHTSGGQARFRTNTKRLLIRAKIHKSKVRYHMTQVGSCGFDLYRGVGNNAVFAGMTKFEWDATEFVAQAHFDSSRSMSDFTLNFPLYNGVYSVEIGIDEKAKLEAPTQLSSDKPVVIYGTSITQGGCATRPGMSYTNILSRRLNREIVNLGFSGSGKGEPEIARLINEIENKALVVLDFECNTHEALRKVLKPFIQELRSADKEVPILVLSRIPLQRDQKDTARAKRDSLRDFQRDLVKALAKAGDRNIYFQDGTTLLEEKWLYEGTVDGTHPTDLGFLMMADSLAPVLSEILEQD